MKKRAPRNRTLSCSDREMRQLSAGLARLDGPAEVDAITDKIINQDLFDCVQFLPDSFVDLLIVDPPYNLTKDYHGRTFPSRSAEEYVSWFDSVVTSLLHVLRPTATVYVCSDWQTSTLVFPVLDRHFCVRNRITWEREKGRGAKANWKNNTEDIWFCTVSDEYHFDVEAVKLKRRVVAPYRTEEGAPKDWEESRHGNYRLTHPSNIWCDVTIPFWSMPENTDHPTQKPEKLIAKLVLASSRQGDFVLDPFAGSGTTPVVARKLGRRFAGVEISTEYCCWAQKRLAAAEQNPDIQGYADGVFWERNSLSDQPNKAKVETSRSKQGVLF